MFQFKFKHSFINHITVEPAFFLFYSTYVILEFLNTNLYLQKACRYSTSTEPDLRTPCDDEKKGIIYVNDVNYYFRFLIISSTTVALILFSNWSDRAGGRRKMFIMLPIAGLAVRSVLGILFSYFWYWNVHLAVLVDVVVQIITGSTSLCVHMCILHASDTSDVKNRTLKVGLVMSIHNACMFIGSGSAGVLLRSFGFFYSYLICLVFSICGLIFAAVFIKNISFPVKENPSIWSIFNIKHIGKSIKLVLFKNKGRKGLAVWFLIIVHFTVWFGYSGQKSIFYLYFRYKFKWDEKHYSYYVMFKLIGLSLGTFFCSFVLSKQLQIHDGIIGTFASFWDTIADTCYTFANETWQLYLIPVLDIFHGAAISVHYSYISKFFDSKEYGQLTSALHIVSLISPLCFPAFSFVFEKTMDFFPSAFFLLSAFFDLLTCILYGASYFLSKNL